MSNTTKDSATEARQVTWPETKKTSAEIEDRLIRARVKLLISQPFFGNLATRLKFVDATDWCPTAELMVVTSTITVILLMLSKTKRSSSWLVTKYYTMYTITWTKMRLVIVIAV